ncbi:MFS transporter [Sphaerimonospora cavernae]|uniref:MFS transporter n=1 Tax=Sphaerimonospora cavernae TaxID=1740611 RepID=A0ABV6UBP1_9ACTN
MRANIPLRLARSAAFSAVSVLLAVGAHWFAGGAAPTPRALLVGGLAVMAGAAALAGRERSPVAVVGLLLAAQASLHQLLGPAEQSGGVAYLPGTYEFGLYDPAVYEDCHPLSVRAGMLFAHLTAALITGWWLSRGETLVWSILHRIGTRAARWLRPLLAGLTAADGAVPRPCPREPERTRPRYAGHLRHTVVRRGPPVLLLS